MTEDKKMELRKFYTNQRDSQLTQLMAINGQGSFSILAVLAGIFIGGLSLKSGSFNLDKYYWLLVIILFGILMLLLATANFSFAYNRKIGMFEKLIRFPVEIEKLDKSAFEIKPKNSGSYMVFFGMLLILIGSFGVVFSHF